MKLGKGISAIRPHLLFCVVGTLFLALLALVADPTSVRGVEALVPLSPDTCGAQTLGDAPHLRLEPVVSGLTSPVYVTHAGDSSSRLFIVERTGTVRILAPELLPEPFLDIRDEVTVLGEEGLLSMAFHPDYQRNGRFFVFYSAKGEPRSVVAEYSVSTDPDRADPKGRVLLEIPQLEGSHVHKGGQLQFGPDGYLYIAIGDGGEVSGDRAQDLSSLNGKLLRINVDKGELYAVPEDNPFVDVEGVRAEVWAYGFRNPWRFSVDSCTGRVFVGDVGEGEREEINLVEPGDNYGWPLMEGERCARGEADEWCEGGFTLPIHHYAHLALDPDGGNSVIGGYIYRGRRFPSLAGRYLFADFSSGRIWTLTETEVENHTHWESEEVFEDDIRFVSFGEGEDGALYVLSAAPEQALFRLIPKAEN